MTNNLEKVYLNLSAPTRQELRTLVGGDHFQLGDKYYYINQVMAEPDMNNAATGSIVGGVIGALGGPVGIVLGGIIGGIIGNSSDDEEKKKIDNFNNSQ